jgi:hypothetical protein
LGNRVRNAIRVGKEGGMSIADDNAMKRMVQVQLTMEELGRVIYGLDDLALQFRTNEDYDVLAKKLDGFYQQIRRRIAAEEEEMEAA